MFKEIFHKKFKIDKKILFLISCVILISPSFRSNIIWPESAMLGLLFFLFSLYFFLKNLNKPNKFNIFFNIFFLAIASYIRPSFCVFSIFFFYKYLTNHITQKFIIQIILVNLLLAFPAVYYVFFLDINFIKFSAGDLNFNIFAVNGQILLNGELDASRMIDISKLENGQYILELGNEGQYTRSTFSKL